MTFRITGTTKTGDEDSLVIIGDTIEDIRDIAKEEVSKRGWTDCWSERLD